MHTYKGSLSLLRLLSIPEKSSYNSLSNVSTSTLSRKWTTRWTVILLTWCWNRTNCLRTLSLHLDGALRHDTFSSTIGTQQALGKVRDLWHEVGINWTSSPRVDGKYEHFWQIKMFKECSIGVGTLNFGEMKWRCWTSAKGWLCESELLSKHVSCQKIYVVAFWRKSNTSKIWQGVHFYVTIPLSKLNTTGSYDMSGDLWAMCETYEQLVVNCEK